MKSFRKLVSMLLALILCCAAGAAFAEEALPADVQAIKDRGTLKVGVKNAVVGFGFQDTLTGEYSGLEIDIANAIAEQLGNARTANMVMLGAIIARTGVISIDSAMEALKATFGPKKEHLLPINRQAMEAGAAAAHSAN